MLALKMDKTNIYRRKQRDVLLKRGMIPCKKTDHHLCDHVTRRQMLIDAWHHPDESSKVRAYWWGFTRNEERRKIEMPSQYRRSAMGTIIRIVSACNGEEFTTPEICRAARYLNRKISWSNSRVARIIAYNQSFLNLEKIGLRSGRVVWRRKGWDSDSKLSESPG